MSTPSHFMKVLDPEYMDTFCFQKWVFAQSRHISAVPEMGTSLQKANIGVPNTSASDAPEMWSIFEKKDFLGGQKWVHFGVQKWAHFGSRNGPLLTNFKLGAHLWTQKWAHFWTPK